MIVYTKTKRGKIKEHINLYQRDATIVVVIVQVVVVVVGVVMVHLVETLTKIIQA